MINLNKVQTCNIARNLKVRFIILAVGSAYSTVNICCTFTYIHSSELQKIRKKIKENFPYQKLFHERKKY